MANTRELARLEEQRKELQTKNKIKLSNKEFTVKENQTITIDKSANYKIKIEDNCNLVLRVESKELITNIHIEVKKGKDVNLLELSNSKESFIKKEITLNKNSKLNFSQIILAARANKTNANLKENSEYNLISAFKISAQETFITNGAAHLEKESKSNLEVNGSSSNGARVTNDGLINIKQSAPNSEGYQKLNNLLLDEESTILSEPILEIDNNNVKCSHGASISQIKDEIIFYTQARGLTKEQATELIIEGFTNKCLENFEEEIVSEIIL